MPVLLNVKRSGQDPEPQSIEKQSESFSDASPTAASAIPDSTRVKNRRKRYLDLHPEYFSSSLELADPLLYDRLIRRFQASNEREAEGRSKGYSGILEADLRRSEAKISALANPSTNAMFSYKRGHNGEIVAEEKEEIPMTKEEGQKRWRWEMELRFLRGNDDDFDYKSVDESDQWDDWDAENREKLEEWIEEEDPEWVTPNGTRGIEMQLKGETGIQDF